MSIRLALISFLPFFISWSEYLVSGLCGALVLNEVVHYVCFRTLIGSCVAFCNSLRHSPSAIVSRGRRYGAHGAACGRFTYSLAQ